MSLLTVTQLAERAGVSEPSVIRKDIRAGLLAATRYGRAWLVDEAEGERWIREIWPRHQANRRKPVGAKTKKRE